MNFFFDYFRQRVRNIRTIGLINADVVAGYPGSMVGEQLILATCGIDTLASHWARVWNISGAKGPLPHGERMTRFLDVHGDASIWNRVAVPHIIRDTSTNGTALAERVRKLPNAVTTRGRMREYRSDLLLNDLLERLRPETPAEKKCILKHTYSNILYKTYRNAWVHDGGGPGTGRVEWHGLSAEEPSYDNWVVGNGTKRVLVLPIGLLLRTYEKAIESFWQACVDEGKDPGIGLNPE
jgi:hypothetical protein